MYLKRVVKSLTGSVINDFYCNGYFGRDYNLEGSIIKKIYKYNHVDSEIVVEILKINGEIKRASFEGILNDWKYAYNQLLEWVK